MILLRNKSALLTFLHWGEDIIEIELKIAPLTLSFRYNDCNFSPKMRKQTEYRFLKRSKLLLLQTDLLKRSNYNYIFLVGFTCIPYF